MNEFETIELEWDEVSELELIDIIESIKGE